MISKLFDKTEEVLNAHPYLVMCLVLIISAALIISRRPEAISNPQFWAEDGNWFSGAYNSFSTGLNPFTSMFVTYGGYFVVVYRLVASISLVLPFKYVPLFFSLCALGFQLLPLVLINSKRLNKIIPYRSLAIAISLLYVSVPNSSEVFLNLTNVQWPLGIAAFLVLIASKSNKILWKIFDLFVLIATGLAGPLVILLLPISGYLWVSAKTAWHKRNLIIVSVLSGVQILAIFFLSEGGRANGQPNASIFKFIKMIVGQVFTGGIFGEKSVDYLYSNIPVLYITFGLMLCVFIYILKNGSKWLKLLNIYGVLIVVSMLASLKPSSAYDVWGTLTTPGEGQRYWFIPIVIWISTLVWLALNAKFRPFKYLAAALLLCLVVFGIPRDWQLPKYPDLQFPAYAQKLESAPKGSLVVIPINPGWHMYLTKR